MTVMKNDYKAGYWYATLAVNTGGASHSSASKSFSAWPFRCPSNQTLGITKIGIYSGGTTGDAGATDMTVEVGFYEANATTHYPAARINASGTLTVNTTGIQTAGAFTEYTMTPGNLYWFVTNKTNTPSNNAISTSAVCVAQALYANPYADADSGTLHPDTLTQPIVGAFSTTMADPFPASLSPGTTVTNYIMPFFYVNSVT